MVLTREQAIAEHRKMWNWIADRTKEEKRKITKEDYFEEYQLERVCGFCFVCEYDENTRISADTPLCHSCPIVFLDHKPLMGDCYCCEKGSPYKSWVDLMKCEWEAAERFARMIANLPEREVE